MLKAKSILLSLAILSLAACGGAQAADANLVKDTGNTFAYGQRLAVEINRDTSSGNRVYVRYLGGGTQLITDDGSWTKHTAAKNAILAVGGMRVGSSDRYINPTLASIVDCSGSNSRVWFPSTMNASEVIGDGCAFRDAVLANSF